MNVKDESRTRIQNIDNPRRSFLRKILGVDAVDEAVVKMVPGSGETSGPVSKTVSIQIDTHRCTACGQCARFCLPGALSLRDSDDLFSLQFTASVCIDCGLCSSVCPERALEIGETLQAEIGLLKEPVEVASGILSHCEVCLAPIAEEVGHTRCFICRQRPATPAFLSAP